MPFDHAQPGTALGDNPPLEKRRATLLALPMPGWCAPGRTNPLCVAALGSSLLLAVLLLVPFLGTIPGLHGDEAWAGVRAHEIAQGKRPMIGMNWYTGPLYHYLLCPGLGILGYHVFALRLFTVVNSLLCVVLYFLLARRLFGERIAALAALALVSLPAFTAYGRPAYEVFALNPVLAAGAVLLLLEANRKSQTLLWLLSGVCLGLGTWNHLIFLAVPGALLAAAFSTKGLSLFRSRALYLVAYGFLLALAPRLFYEAASSSTAGFAQKDAAHSLPQVLHRGKEWPALLVQMVHGDPTFRRFTGQVTFHSPEMVWPILLAGFAAHLKRRGPRWGVAGWRLLVFSVTLFATTLWLCPKNSDRYFLLVLYVVPLFVACAFSEFFEWAPVRRWAALAFCAFLCLQMTRTVCNYFLPQIQTHGLISEYRFGSKPETSSNYIRTDGLYKQLVALGASRVYAEFFITMPLRFYDLQENNFASAQIVDSARAVPAADACRQGDYAVVYVGGLRRVRADQYRGFQEVSRDDHFIILKPSAAAAAAEK